MHFSLWHYLYRVSRDPSMTDSLLTTASDTMTHAFLFTFTKKSSQKQIPFNQVLPCTNEGRKDWEEEIKRERNEKGIIG